jgi:spore germination protein PE
MKIRKRISNVENVKIQTVNSSGVFQVGDSLTITPSSKALAVQREGAVFLGDEGNFDLYPLFSFPFPPLENEKNNCEDIEMTFINKQPNISTNNVYILSLAASGVFQIGSTKKIECETRVKHFRQLYNQSEHS